MAIYKNRFLFVWRLGLFQVAAYGAVVFWGIWLGTTTAPRSPQSESNWYITKPSFGWSMDPNELTLKTCLNWILYQAPGTQLGELRAAGLDTWDTFNGWFEEKANQIRKAGLDQAYADELMALALGRLLQIQNSLRTNGQPAPNKDLIDLREVAAIWAMVELASSYGLSSEMAGYASMYLRDPHLTTLKWTLKNSKGRPTTVEMVLGKPLPIIL